jgi:alkylation response protein AidB-like acyl-CoA dehydrogenase
MEQMGLWGLTVPEAFGGGGLDLLTTCLIEMELSRTFVPLEIGEAPAPLYACRGEQAARYLEPVLAGDRRAILAARESGALSPEKWTTTAVLKAGEYELTGCKEISAAPVANDFLILYAKAPEGLSAFLVDYGHPGLSIVSRDRTRLKLTGCLLPSDAVLGEPGQALGLGAGLASQAWIRMGARYVGLVERLIEMGVEYTRDWISLGAPLAVRPAIQRMLAEMQVDVESSRWLVYHAAWLVDTGAGDQARQAAAQVRLATGEMLQRSVDRITMVFAGPGPTPQIEPQRLASSLAPAEVLEYALEQARAAVAAELLKD